jgi:hypothetical protein
MWVFSPMRHSCSTMAPELMMQCGARWARALTIAPGAMNAPGPTAASGATVALAAVTF